MTFGNLQTLALKIRQKSSLLETSGGEEPWCFEWFCLGWPCHSCPVPSAIRVKPHRGYPFGKRYAQQGGCSALSGYDSGCAVDGNGHNLLSARETSGHPAEASLTPEVPLTAVNPVSLGGPNVETSFSYLTPQILSFKFSQLWHLLPTLIPQSKSWCPKQFWLVAT